MRVGQVVRFVPKYVYRDDLVHLVGEVAYPYALTICKTRRGDAVLQTMFEEADVPTCLRCIWNVP